MFDHLLESSHRDDFNKWSNIGFGKKFTQIVSIEVKIFCIFSRTMDDVGKFLLISTKSYVVTSCLNRLEETIPTKNW